MAKFNRSNKRDRGAETSAMRELAVAPAEAPVRASMDAQDGIPAHVWEMLQEAGERAAERLRDILASKAFDSYAPTAKARLIELAFTRAFGLPVRRSVEVSLSSSDADAVAQSLLALRDKLPERRDTPGATIDASASETRASGPENEHHQKLN